MTAYSPTFSLTHSECQFTVLRSTSSPSTKLSPASSSCMAGRGIEVATPSRFKKRSRSSPVWRKLYRAQESSGVTVQAGGPPSPVPFPPRRASLPAVHSGDLASSRTVRAKAAFPNQTKPNQTHLDDALMNRDPDLRASTNKPYPGRYRKLDWICR
jgi:hypothetical protein